MIGEMIKKALEERGMKQYELADEVGYTSAMISQIISGKVLPSEHKAWLICQKLDLNIKRFSEALSADRVKMHTERLMAGAELVHAGSEDNEAVRELQERMKAIEMIDANILLAYVLEIPLFDKLPEGNLVEAAKSIPESDFIFMDSRYVLNPESTLALRIGDDIAVVDMSIKPKDGDIVVIIYDETYSIKKIRHQKDIVLLVPVEPGGEIIILTDRIRIAGVVIQYNCGREVNGKD